LIRPVRLFPDPVLCIPCRKIDQIDEDALLTLKDLQDTLSSSPGVGLAAPQIGKPVCIAVIDVSKDKRRKARSGTNHGFQILINPKILHSEGIQIPREGCLSVPDLLADVKRANYIRVSAKDVKGNERVLEVEGFEALAVQHEIDHLNGKLFLDRVTNLKTDLFRRKT